MKRFRSKKYETQQDTGKSIGDIADWVMTFKL